VALHVAGVWVTEYLPEQKVLRSLAFWMNDGYVENYEYAIQGTPCEQVIEQQCLVNYPDRIIELFPDDSDLVKLSAVSYLGVPLLKPDGAVLGHLSALDTKPLNLTADVESVFRFFAARATAELIRLQAESVVHDSEERFVHLFDSAMDGIFELDAQLRIVRANSSAAMLFAMPVENLGVRDFSTLLTPLSTQKLSSVVQRLENTDEYSAWVPGGLDAVRADGSRFPAEASVSRFEMAGQHHYSVILRNVREQLAAETWVDELEDDREDLHEMQEHQVPGEIMGSSAAIRKVVSAIRQVAATPATVLITGETGTGKELVARAIHQASLRAAKPFIRVNCSAIPASLCESEFFGHEKGAFTGAVTRRAGRFELAHGGVIFLDEVGELPLELQPKLLRVLQEREYEPVGSSQTRKVDVRVIAATNRNLAAEVAAGRFREDLFYRLNVFPVEVPPLRERGSDVELLAKVFVERYCARIGKPRSELTADCLRRLRAYQWPGNVRQLENVIERAVIMARDQSLSIRNVLPLDMRPSARGGDPAAGNRNLRTKRELREIERDILVTALEQSGWKVAGPHGAAQTLGVPPSTLSSRMKALRIERPAIAAFVPLNSPIVAREIERNENSLGANHKIERPSLC
jgi:PAS domain S-box-containing protein